MAEQGILEMLVKTLELIYYKTNPYEEREVAFINARLKKKKQRAEEDEAEIIAQDYLVSVSEKVLKAILILINKN